MKVSVISRLFSNFKNNREITENNLEITEKQNNREIPTLSYIEKPTKIIFLEIEGIYRYL